MNQPVAKPQAKPLVEAKPEPPTAPEQLHSDEVGPGWYNIIRETRVNVAIGFDSTKVTSLEQGSRVRVPISVFRG